MVSSINEAGKAGPRGREPKKETTMSESTTLKRTHKTPYKVGKLYFGRSAPEKGAHWIVSASMDLSDPVAKFEAGKLARAYCEEARDAARANKASAISAEVTIPTGEEFTDILSDDTVEFDGTIDL
jgi:hypothetical protein